MPVGLHSIRDLTSRHWTELENEALVLADNSSTIQLGEKEYSVKFAHDDLVVQRAGLNQFGWPMRFFNAVADMFLRRIESGSLFDRRTRSQQMTDLLRTLKSQELVSPQEKITLALQSTANALASTGQVSTGTVGSRRVVLPPELWERVISFLAACDKGTLSPTDKFATFS
ncbi:hypothetical protein [Paraburkholderia sediminicola]|uniref:hypothetical protein n=1 Tax=Paraburkholderia sediminicola TaxID=458836 RepID=UPI0038B9E803